MNGFQNVLHQNKHLSIPFFCELCEVPSKSACVVFLIFSPSLVTIAQSIFEALIWAVLSGTHAILFWNCFKNCKYPSFWSLCFCCWCRFLRSQNDLVAGSWMRGSSGVTATEHQKKTTKHASNPTKKTLHFNYKQTQQSF